MANNIEDTLKNLNALLAFLRTLGYDTTTVTLSKAIAILTRISDVVNEELDLSS